MQAVLTGDLIASTDYSQDLRDEVASALKKEFAILEEEHGGVFSIWRGDSFQGTLRDAGDALSVSLRLKALVNKIEATPSAKKVKSQAPVADIRIAVAIGEVANIAAEPAEANDEVFVKSGQALDSMDKKKRTLLLNSPDSAINRELEVELTLLEHIIERWSVASAELVYLKLSGLSDQQIAKQLEISLPAVYKRKKIAGWNTCEVMIRRYKELLGIITGYRIDKPN